jgi:RND superfamily putative drug exporter
MSRIIRFSSGLGCDRVRDVAIAVDATRVRLGLLPAVMRLSGDWTWWIPTWLDKRMPTFDIEGSEFEHHAGQTHMEAALSAT